MKKCFVVAALVALCATTANATNIWLGVDNLVSPLGEVPMVMQRPGEEGWLYIWLRPDASKTLANISLNVDSTDPNIIWFTGGRLVNPLLGTQTFPPPPKPIKRFEFVNDSSNADLGMDSLTNMAGFSVANQQTIGAGMGPFTAGIEAGLSPPTYNPNTDAWLLGSIHWKAHRPGHVEIFLEIGGIGINNAGETTAQTGVVFGDAHDIVLNGDTGREEHSERPEAIIWIIPEPSTFALVGVGLVALIPYLRRR